MLSLRWWSRMWTFWRFERLMDGFSIWQRFVPRILFGSYFIFSFLAATSPVKKELPPKTPLHIFKNWGLENSTNQSGIDADIDAVDAWKLQKGNPKIIVAVIDTGFSSHKDLSTVLWRDPAHKTESIYGWDFNINKPNPVDDHGHGTNINGIISASINYQEGIAGVAPGISIMPIKYYSENNSGATNLKNTILAIHYAIDHGAKIINYSGGGPQYSKEEHQAIQRALKENVLIVAAAGNDGKNTDTEENYYYPAAYHMPNILTVAATDKNNKLLGTSNFGKKVDVAAPGDEIYSTLPNNRYGAMTGTSQATAFVTGIAALILSEDPSLKPFQVRQIIMETVDIFPGKLENKVGTKGRVNAFKAILATKARKKEKTQKEATTLSLPLDLFNGLTGSPLQLVF